MKATTNTLALPCQTEESHRKRHLDTLQRRCAELTSSRGIILKQLNRVEEELDVVRLLLRALPVNKQL